MNRKDFLLLLDEVIEAEPGTLTGAESLKDIAWDSLSVLGFIALMDERFGFEMSPKKLSKCETVNDLVALAGEQVTAD